MNGPLFAALIGAGLGAGCLLIIRALRPRPSPFSVAIACAGRTRAVRSALRSSATDGDLRRTARPLGLPGSWRLRTRRQRTARRAASRARQADRTSRLREAARRQRPGSHSRLFAYAGLTAGGVNVSPVAASSLRSSCAAGGIPLPGPAAGRAGRATPAGVPPRPVELARSRHHHPRRRRWHRDAHSPAPPNAGDGWAFDEIRLALRRAELTGRPPWDAPRRTRRHPRRHRTARARRVGPPRRRPGRQDPPIPRGQGRRPPSPAGRRHRDQRRDPHREDDRPGHRHGPRSHAASSASAPSTPSAPTAAPPPSPRPRLSHDPRPLLAHQPTN